MIDIFTDCNAPRFCPQCGAELVVSGVDLMCPNKNCPAKEFQGVVAFLRDMGIEYAAEKSIENWHINTFNDLINFRPDTSVMQNKFYNQLIDKVYKADKITLLKHLPWGGLNTKSIDKIINCYSLEAIESGEFMELAYKGHFPNGIGATLLGKFNDRLEYNLNIADMIMSDPRYVVIETTDNTKNDTPKLGTVCITGKLDTMTRNEAEAKAISMGYDISPVNAKLTILVCNDINSTSSKMTKAKKFGIKIMSEKEFFNI